MVLHQQLAIHLSNNCSYIFLLLSFLQTVITMCVIALLCCNQFNVLSILSFYRQLFLGHSLVLLLCCLVTQCLQCNNVIWQVPCRKCVQVIQCSVIEHVLFMQRDTVICLIVYTPILSQMEPKNTLALPFYSYTVLREQTIYSPDSIFKNSVFYCLCRYSMMALAVIAMYCVISVLVVQISASLSRCVQSR